MFGEIIMFLFGISIVIGIVFVTLGEGQKATLSFVIAIMFLLIFSVDYIERKIDNLQQNIQCESKLK